MKYFRYIVILVLAFLAVDGVQAQRKPTATILGSNSKVCVGDSVAAYIYCSGDDPFDLVINDSHGKYLELKDVGYQLTIWLKPEQNEVYYIKEVKDSHGRKGDTFGEVEVSVYQTTPVSILLDRTAYFYTEPGVLLQATPSGGTFSGNGVIGNTFYPSIATPDGSPHEIVYSYNNTNGCISTDMARIYVLYGEAEVYLVSGSDTVATLCDNGETFEIRGSNKDHAAGEFELRAAGSEDPIDGPIVDEDPKDNEAVLNPAGLSGLYDIFYTYTVRGLTAQASYRFLVSTPGEITVPDLPGEVCQGSDPYLLVPDLAGGDPEAVYGFSGPGVTGNQEEGYYFDPGNPEVEPGENVIQVEFTSSQGCSANASITVLVYPSPVVEFGFDPACISSGGGLLAFENLTNNKEEIESWGWEFGDPGSGVDNFSNLENPTHYYAEPGPRTISLAALTTTGCLVRHTIDTVLNDIPFVDFNWIHDCTVAGEETRFVNHSYSSFSVLDTFVWTFMTSGGSFLGEITTDSPDTVGYSFAGIGSYRVILNARSAVGCQAEVTKEIHLKPNVALSATPYEEGFNEAGHEWSAGTENGELSWLWNTPDFEGYAPPAGDKAWYTDLPEDQAGFVEHSWVESPCFDFRGTTHPVLKLDIMKSFRPGLDGAVLQYRTENSEVWSTLGQPGEGVNWYNVNGIALLPGGSNYGWGLETFEPDQGWVRATHDLGALAGYNHVKLRITLGSGASVSGTGNQGFAFDNLFIGEPVRRSLIEYFTNSGSPVCLGTDEIVDQLTLAYPGRVIDLQYHMDYPDVDLMNLNNPYPPTTRAFNYGVQEVPLAILNGGAEETDRFDFSGPDQEPGEEVLQEASLEEPLFDLDLDVNWMENSLEVNTQVTCRTDEFNANLQLYVAVIETYVSAYPGLNGDSVFRNVVLDILPSSAGQLLGDSWFDGKNESRNFTWGYQDYVEDPEELAVVAFVQDRDAGNVLQVAIDYRTPLVTQKPHKTGVPFMKLYPNPATDLLFVQLQAPQESRGMIRILDLTGKAVFATGTMPGSSLYRIDVSGLQPGAYVLCRLVNGTVVERSRILLTR